MIYRPTSTVKYSARFRAVQAYHKNQFSVIPAGDDKRPLVAWREFQFRLASEDELQGWWVRWPGANIGIVTGKISGITVIDCDSANAVAWIEEQLPDSFLCPIVSTPRGGRHYWLGYTPELRTGAHVLPGIDIRNDGGYVLAPPSMVPRGVYSWVSEGE